MLEAWRKRADDPSLPVEERQLILLSMVHPLWVRLEEALYRDAHTAESEEAFNRRLPFWRKCGTWTAPAFAAGARTSSGKS